MTVMLIIIRKILKNENISAVIRVMSKLVEAIRVNTIQNTEIDAYFRNVVMHATIRMIWTLIIDISVIQHIRVLVRVMNR